ncbi:hypothetical protein KIPB_012384, partial [Kipferlia bialata]
TLRSGVTLAETRRTPGRETGRERDRDTGRRRETGYLSPSSLSGSPSTSLVMTRMSPMSGRLRASGGLAPIEESSIRMSHVRVSPVRMAVHNDVEGLREDAVRQEAQDRHRDFLGRLRTEAEEMMSTMSYSDYD